MLRAAGRRILGLGSGHRAPEAAMASRGYHERVVDYYDNPRNVGSFDKSDPTLGTGLVGARACGDVMKLQIKVDDATGKIVDACFKTFGCGSAIASSSVGLTHPIPDSRLRFYLSAVCPSIRLGCQPNVVTSTTHRKPAHWTDLLLG
ncbi:hypothetical protein BHE74_00012427, partial [Ensete ventricosum]